MYYIRKLHRMWRRSSYSERPFIGAALLLGCAAPRDAHLWGHSRISKDDNGCFQKALLWEPRALNGKILAASKKRIGSVQSTEEVW